MRAAGIEHVVFELVDIAVGTEDGAVGGIEGREKSIAVTDGGLDVIGRREKWRGANVSERGCKTQVRRKRSGIFDGGVALVIEELYAESGIDGGLIGIGDRAIDLVQAEAREQGGFVGQTVVDADGELIGVGDDF